MEANVMKKNVISGIVLLTVFISAISVFGQPADKSDQQKEQLENIRQRWQNMSDEEKEKLRPKIQDRIISRGAGLEGQLEAVKTIEEQVVKLKAAIESMIQSRSQYQNASEQEKVLYSKKMAEAAQTRQQAIASIEQQFARFRFREQRQIPEPQTRLDELQEIHQLAVKEKATETAQRLESLIARFQQRQSRIQGIRPGQREERTERVPGERQPGSQDN
jgi:DNA repair exonuclease SbcCD ATPase subunit